MQDDNQTDPLQQQDDIFNPKRDEERLDEDGSTPASPLDSEEDAKMPPDYPSTDTDIDPGGAYFGGIAEEAGYKPEPEEHNPPTPLSPEDDDTLG